MSWLLGLVGATWLPWLRSERWAIRLLAWSVGCSVFVGLARALAGEWTLFALTHAVLGEVGFAISVSGLVCTVNAGWRFARGSGERSATGGS